MSTQQLVSPEKIEAELPILWDRLAKKNKVRASLFNLIIFSSLSPRTDYFREVLQKIIGSYPSRIIFITHDPSSSQNYLKTAISVATPSQESLVACDQIDIGVAGTDWERVPSVVLPHIIPDLPVILLWAEDPTTSHPLLDALMPLATRLIFDSESTSDLFLFAKTLLSLYENQQKSIADLNWGRLEGWRDLLFSTFSQEDNLIALQKVEVVKICYNNRESDIFRHRNVQSLYLLALFSTRLSWNLKTTKDLYSRFIFDPNIEVSVTPEVWLDLGSGSVTSIHLSNKQQDYFTFSRNASIPHIASVFITREDHCERPYQFQFGKTFSGKSLVREIFQKGTSPFFIESLRKLLILSGFTT